MTTFGRPRRHFRVTDSTNERARELATAGAPSGTVVTASEQTAGRGRRGRPWVATPGGALLYSAILRPLANAQSLLPLAAAVATCEAIEAVAPIECRVKWPNDVWIDERKVAGILIEARVPDWAVIGVGVNVAAGSAPPSSEHSWPATAIGHGVTLEAARIALDGALTAWVDAEAARVLDAFRARDALHGREVAWRGSRDDARSSGAADGIDDAGNLVVVLGDGERSVLGAGEVSLVPAARSRPRREAS